MKPFFSFLLAVCILLTLLTGCIQTPAETDTVQTGYTVQCNDLYDGKFFIKSCMPYHGRLWLYGFITGTDETIAVSCLPDGQDFQEIDLPQSKDGRFHAMFPEENGVILLECVCIDNTQEQPTAEDNLWSFVWIQDGQEISRVELPELSDSEIVGFGIFSYHYLQDASGRFWFHTEKGYVVYNADGSFAGQVKGDTVFMGTPVSDRDGNLYALHIGLEGFELRKIDTEKFELGDKIDLKKIERASGTAYPVIGGAPDVCFYGTLYAYDGTEFQKKLELNTLNIDPANIRHIFRIAEDCWTIILERDTQGEELAYISVGEKTEKETVSLSVFGTTGNLESMVIAFNKQNAKYQVKLTDWFADGTDHQDAMMRFQTQAAAGELPDMIEVSGIAYEPWIQKEYLQDLYPLLDEDTDYRREDFVSAFLKASEDKGKLYALPLRMAILSAVSTKSLVGTTSTNPTYAESLRLMEENSATEKLFATCNREDTLKYLLQFGASDWIDREHGICRLDEAGFAELLELCQKVQDTNGTEHADSLLSEKKALYEVQALDAVSAYQLVGSKLGEEAVWIGIPTAFGENGTVGYSSTRFCITQNCQNTDAAWSFLKYLLETENNAVTGHLMGFPILKTAYEQELADAAEVLYSVSGEKCPHMSYSDDNGFYYDIYEATPEDLAAIRALTEQVKKVIHPDEALLKIIMEEASAFFNGQKTAEETAAIVQNRLQIYLAEGQ